MAIKKYQTLNAFDFSNPIIANGYIPSGSISFIAYASNGCVCVPIELGVKYTISGIIRYSGSVVIRYGTSNAVPTSNTTLLRVGSFEQGETAEITAQSGENYLLIMFCGDSDYSAYGSVQSAYSANCANLHVDYSAWNTIGYKKYETATDTITSLPQTIIGDGQNISAWSMKGNMSQSGTPTPSNPIYPTECGDKTANLLNVSEIIWADTVCDDNGNESSSTTSHHTTNFTKVSPSTTYTLGGTLYLSDAYVRIYFYSSSKTWISRTAGYERNTAPVVVFTTPANCEYVQVQTGKNVTGSNFMLVSGEYNVQTMPAYEPFGYKIPISLNNVTYPIYISEPLRKSLDGSNLYDTIESNGTLTRRVDANGDALATPTTEQVTVPTLTTTGTAEQFNVLTTLAPSEVSLTYHGWHEHSDTKYTTP